MKENNADDVVNESERNLQADQTDKAGQGDQAHKAGQGDQADRASQVVEGEVVDASPSVNN